MEAARQVQEIAGGGRTAQRSAADGPAGCGADGTEAQEDQGAVEQLAKLALEQVTTQVRAMRAREGDALRRDLTEHLDALAQLRERMAARAPQVPQAYRERLTARLAELARAGAGGSHSGWHRKWLSLRTNAPLMRSFSRSGIPISRRCAPAWTRMAPWAAGWIS